MKKIYVADFFLLAFENEVYFMNFHFNIGIYRGLNMDEERNSPVVTEYMTRYGFFYFNRTSGLIKKKKTSISH